MISRETRASGLLRQLSRARPMTAAGLVSETHMQLGSHRSFAGRLRNEIRTIRKVTWFWKTDTQFISSSISRNIT